LAAFIVLLIKLFSILFLLQCWGPAQVVLMVSTNGAGRYHLAICS